MTASPMAAISSWKSPGTVSRDDTELHQPKPKAPAQALAIAQEYVDEWMPSA